MIDLEERLVTYIDDAHGLEQHMRRPLDGLIERTNDPEIQGVLRHHKEETDRHRQRLAERLAAHDATPSTVKDAGQIFVALTKEIIDRARPGSGGKIFSDGCVAEHLEITSYDEEAMVAELRAGWDQRLQA